MKIPTDKIIASCVCHKARMAARAVTRFYDKALKSVELKATQYSLLVAVAAFEVVSIGQLAGMIGMERSTLTRNLDLLEKGKLVKIGNEGWRRRRVVSLTPLGSTKISQATPLWEHAQETLRAKLGESQWSRVEKNLTYLAEII